MKFSLLRYFLIASTVSFALVAITLVLFENRQSDDFKRAQAAAARYFETTLSDFAKRHDQNQQRDLLAIHESGNVNLTRVLANSLWEKDFAPFVAVASQIAVDQCRAIADIKDAKTGKAVLPPEKKTCYAEVGKRIMGLPAFSQIDAKVFDVMKQSAVFKIKVFDLRGIVVYSSEHAQVGEDKKGYASWQSAVAGTPASELTHRDKFSAFEGVVENRDVISSYLPVLGPGTKQIVGVFEVYSDVTQFLGQIKKTGEDNKKFSSDAIAALHATTAEGLADGDRKSLLAIFVVTGLLMALFVTLFVVVRRAQKLLISQESDREKTHQRFRDIAGVSADWIWEVDAQARYTYASDGVKAMLGYAPEEILGKTPFDLMSAEEAQRVASAFNSIVAAKQSFRDLENIVLGKDGSPHVTLTNGTPILDTHGNLLGYRGIDRDITERKADEEAHEASEQRIRNMSDAAGAYLWEHDTNFIYTYVSSQSTHVKGYSPAELLGHSPMEFMPEEDVQSVGDIVGRAIASGSTFRLQHRDLTRDGKLLWEEVYGAPYFDDNGKLLGLRGTGMNINARKQAEAELQLSNAQLAQAKDAAETANVAKDAFLANMSHELRTPLSAVIGMADLAQGISTDPKLTDYLEKIVRSGKHLNRIINELLDLSKIAAGQMELEIITFSLRTMIAHVESLMSHRAAEKGLAIVVAIDDAVPDVLLGDPTRVTQIFLNLIGNAIKFTQAGQITVRVGLRTHKESRVCLDIAFEDTGIGMRPDDLKQLFQPFVQADATVNRKYGGTGLGLTISRRLAEMMDGDINVTSIEGTGTTFKLTIWLGLGNAADLSMAEPAVDEALPMRYQDARVLVADDQPLNREIVEALLATVGIKPRLAGNGQEVLDILNESGPDAFDLVLMDIQMPVMDGLTATRVLRSRAGFDKLPIIAMTAHTLAHEQELNAAAGMNDHIGKPFDNPSFYRTLAKWIPQAKQKATDATQALPAKHEALPEAGTELSSLRGVDVAAGLARFSGKEASYRRWLGDFVATAGSVPGQMRGEIAAGQTDKAGKLAHVFKGRVGMLGMTELHGMVSALELVLNEGAPADELLTTLERSINEMRHELARVVNPGAADPAKSLPAKPILESVVWNDSYSVGVPALDDQHKKLVGMINRLADCHAARSNGSSGAFHEVLSRMFDYTQVHFKDEEDYLQRIGYPRLADHKTEHAAFVGKMAAFSMAASEGIQDEAAVHRYLKAWLLSHILESDMQYRSFVESKL